jgi:hypothetical protein
MGRYRPVAATAEFSTWQPTMLPRPAGFGQKRTFRRTSTALRTSIAIEFMHSLMNDTVWD